MSPSAAMGTYEFTTHVAAPPETVFDLWVSLDRMAEWVEGVTKVTDVTGPSDQAGTRYTVWFGWMRSPTQIVAAEEGGGREVAGERVERDCPYCAERILARARVCRFCGRDVEPVVQGA